MHLSLPDGRIASGSRDKTVKLWDPTDGSVQAFKKHATPISGLEVLPDGRIVSTSAKLILVWDPEIDDVVPRVSNAPINCVTYNPVHNQIVCGTARGLLVLELVEKSLKQIDSR